MDIEPNAELRSIEAALGACAHQASPWSAGELAAVLDLREIPLANPLPFWVRKGLREDWRALQDAGRESISQAVGRAAFLAGLEGLIVPSHASRKGYNAVLFPANLRPGSRITARI